MACGLSGASIFANTDSGTARDGRTAPVGVIEYDELTPAQNSGIRLLEIVTAVWFFIVGSCVGSFMNVVVYRLPFGMSLTKPKSRCPVCDTPIRRGDNLPLIGWLRLRGRCRTCKAKISPRYPLVEASVGLMVLSLLHIELLSGGANLPWRMPNHYAGVLWIIWYAKWDLIGIYLYHCGLLCILMTAALIETDRRTIPVRPLIGCLLIGLVLPILWPTLHPVPFHTPPWESLDKWQWKWTVEDTIFTPGWDLSIGLSLRGLLDGLVGLSAGALICGLAILMNPFRSENDLSRSTYLCLCALVGVVLGWQATVSAILFSSILRVLLAMVCHCTNWTACLTAGTALQICLGRFLSDLPYWPSHQSEWFVHAGALAGIVVLTRFQRNPAEEASLPVS